MPREAQALTTVDLLSAAAAISCPVLLLLGERSPPWAGDITRALAAALPAADLAVLPGQGHEAVDSAPELVVSELRRFFGGGAAAGAAG
jgi:pimeloyl-ACP methyl ester carboxylesterase